MKTLKEGNKEVLKEYKYFKCRKCGWIGKAEKGEYTYIPGEYIYPGYYICTCVCCNGDANEVKESDENYKIIKELDMNEKQGNSK